MKYSLKIISKHLTKIKYSPFSFTFLCKTLAMGNVLETGEPPAPVEIEVDMETTHDVTEDVTSTQRHLLAEDQSSGHSLILSVIEDSQNTEQLKDNVSTEISSSSSNQGVEIVKKREKKVDAEKPVSPSEGESLVLSTPPATSATNGAIDLSVKHSNADGKSVCDNESIKILCTDEEFQDSDSQIETETFPGEGNNSSDSKASAPKEKSFHVSCFQATSENYSDEESDSGYSALFSLQSPKQAPHPHANVASVKSTGPAVFIGRSAYFKRLYYDTFDLCESCKCTDISPPHIIGLMGRVLCFESVTKNELHYLKMELECQLGDHGDNNGDASSSPLSETDDSEYEGEGEEEDVYDNGVNGEYNLEEQEHCESDDGETEKGKTDSDLDIKSSESEDISQDESAIRVTSSPTSTGILTPVSSLIDKDSSNLPPPPLPPPLSIQSKPVAELTLTLSSNQPPSVQTKKAIAVPSLGTVPLIKENLNTDMKYKYVKREQSDPPYVVGRFVFYEKNRRIQLEVHNPSQKLQYVSTFCIYLKLLLNTQMFKFDWS